MDFRLSSATLVSVEGELDISTAEELAEPTRLAVNADCPLILDLSAGRWSWSSTIHMSGTSLR
jgi:hypothetical protein